MVLMFMLFASSQVLLVTETETICGEHGFGPVDIEGQRWPASSRRRASTSLRICTLLSLIPHCYSKTLSCPAFALFILPFFLFIK